MARTYSIRKLICFIRKDIATLKFHCVYGELFNCICGVMVSMLPSTAVDRVFEPRSGPTQTIIQALVFVASPLSTQQ
jgi:hypothetical protein